MGYYVHLHVAFSCSSNDGVAFVANKHFERSCGPDAKESAWFLRDLAGRTGENPGPKGGLSLWGIIGNYTDHAKFVDDLHDFWVELLSGEVEGGPCEHHHILVFYENEQSEQAHCYEIGLTQECQDRLGEYFEQLGDFEVVDDSTAKDGTRLSSYRYRTKPGPHPPKPPLELEIKHHALPFAWMQY